MILQFKPDYVQISFAEFGGYNRIGWRIVDTFYDHTWTFNERDCVFANQRDCQAACDSLNQENLTEEVIEAMSDEQFGELIVRNLRW